MTAIAKRYQVLGIIVAFTLFIPESLSVNVVDMGTLSVTTAQALEVVTPQRREVATVPVSYYELRDGFASRGAIELVDTPPLCALPADYARKVLLAFPAASGAPVPWMECGTTTIARNCVLLQSPVLVPQLADSASNLQDMIGGKTCAAHLAISEPERRLHRFQIYADGEA